MLVENGGNILIEDSPTWYHRLPVWDHWRHGRMRNGGHFWRKIHDCQCHGHTCPFCNISNDSGVPCHLPFDEDTGTCSGNKKDNIIVSSQSTDDDIEKSKYLCRFLKVNSQLSHGIPTKKLPQIITKVCKFTRNIAITYKKFFCRDTTALLWIHL